MPSVGNCQGGWAAMMLAASDPGDTGPIVVNGAPMSYWGGAWRVVTRGWSGNQLSQAEAVMRAIGADPSPVLRLARRGPARVA